MELKENKTSCSRREKILLMILFALLLCMLKTPFTKEINTMRKNKEHQNVSPISKTVSDLVDIECNEYDMAYYVFYTDKTRSHIQTVTPVVNGTYSSGVDCNSFIEYKKSKQQSSGD